MKTFKKASPSGIEMEIKESKIKVLSIAKGQYDDDRTETAQLRMDVLTTAFLQSKQISNEFQDNVFSPAECGYETEKKDSLEKRMAFLPVPAGTTVEQLQKLLDEKFPNARIYRILSSEPIVRKGQQYRIDKGELSLDTIISNQTVVDKNGELILFNGQPQYRQTFFNKDGLKEDVDTRTTTVTPIAKKEEVLESISMFDEE
jgi:hypothetical protein